MSPPDFARGIIFGGLIVTLNFHLLSRTLKNALTPPQLSSHNVILVKYYIRFIASGFNPFYCQRIYYFCPYIKKPCSSTGAYSWPFSRGSQYHPCNHV